MKINTKLFLSILSPLQSVVNQNHSTPILQTVKLDFTKESLTATGDNLEVRCSNSFKLKSVKEVSLCVDFSMLLSAIKVISDTEVNVAFLKNSLSVTHQKGNFKIPTYEVIEFPNPQNNKFDKKATIDCKTFKSSLKVANKFLLDDQMDTMGNVSISISDSIWIRATDKHRLFSEKIKGSGDSEDILLSNKSSSALFALIEDSEELQLRYNSDKIYFKFSNTEIIVIQQKGTFPIKMFSTLIDTIKQATELKLDVNQFSTALKRVSVLSAKDKNPSVTLDITKKKWKYLVLMKQ